MHYRHFCYLYLAYNYLKLTLMVQDEKIPRSVTNFGIITEQNGIFIYDECLVKYK